MKFFRLDLLTLLISLFILNSCKNPDGIGLGLDSSTQLNGILIDTASISVATLPDVPVVTSAITKTPFGYFNDPVMGTTEANVAVTLNLPFSSAFTVPSGNLSIDSAVLVLKYGDGFYGDSLTSKYQINVYQLSQQINSQTSYYNNQGWAHNLTPIGSRSFYARTHDSLKITSIVSGKPDTLIKVPAQLRVKISNSFVNNVLFNASLLQLSSNDIFQSNVKGLYLTVDKTQTTGAGGIFMLGLIDSLNVYYKTVSSAGVIDTAMVQMPLSTHAAQIIHTPSTTLQTELSDTSGSHNLVYLQGLAGTKGRIRFPYLKNIVKNLGNIVINRAELVVTPAPGSTLPSYLTPQPKLTLYRYDIAKTPVEVPDASSSDLRSTGLVPFGGFYSPVLNSYHFLITAYIQDLISGKLVDYGTFIAPVDNTNTTSVDIAPTPQTAGRVVAVGTVTDKSSANYPYRIKLNIVYTKIK